MGNRNRVTTWHMAVTLVVCSVGCAHTVIPQTEVEDTPENREIVGLVEAYRQALETKDLDALMELVSPRYYEDNGTVDSSDDYDYAGLKEGLKEDFKRTQTIKVELRVEAVEVDDDNAFAEIYYDVRAQNEYPSGLRWQTGNDRSRLSFERDDEGRWWIIRGL